MSDLAAAAAAMGVPEALVKRSAEARAKATGASVDEILGAWAGGTPAPTASAAPTQEAAAGLHAPAASDEAASAPDAESPLPAEVLPAEDGAPPAAPPAHDLPPRPRRRRLHRCWWGSGKESVF